MKHGIFSLVLVLVVSSFVAFGVPQIVQADPPPIGGPQIGILLGYVVRADGSPAPNEVINVYRLTQNNTWQLMNGTFSDANGAYQYSVPCTSMAETYKFTFGHIINDGPPGGDEAWVGDGTRQGTIFIGNCVEEFDDVIQNTPYE